MAFQLLYSYIVKKIESLEISRETGFGLNVFLKI